MSFSPYEKYIESGVPWLGRTPADWEVLPTKRFALRIKDLNHGMKCEERLALTMSGVIPRSLDDLEGLQASEFESYQIFHKDDLAFKLIDLQNIKTSRVGIVPFTGIMSPAYIRLVIDKNLVYPKFAYWFFTDLYNRHIFNQLGGGVRQTLGPEELLLLPFARPTDIRDQIHIARFLDHETARIDALIEEQQRLIELLKEKRQAVISHAVTKGLDPTVPMKDSGVEWLGEVPAHWDVKALRYLGECQNGINIGGDAFGSGSPFVSYGDVYKNYVLPIEVAGLVQSSHEDRQRYSVKAGDVFFTRTSETVDEIGFSATCLQDLPDAVFAGFLIRFRPAGESIDPRFSKYYFRNQGLRIFFNKQMNLVTRASLSQDLLKLLPVTLPPVTEQIKIADFLDRVTSEFASLLEQGLRSIDLLTERRSTLISAAVTGKIDVRGWQPPASTQNPELAVAEAV